MNNLNPRGNLSAAIDPAESETARLVGRARVMMVISALTTALAIAAVVTVIGYRAYSGANAIGPITDEIVPLPKGAKVISTSASAGRVLVLLDINGVTELRSFDVKTMKQMGRIRFANEP
ncbi:MAG TPA: hypothetical protein VH206_02200 [Xanthobacteraceae bacterium]|jgi:hypothetical protein|nr:hypothetical protein [Xanthobacteraceae bacterium]